MYKDLLNSLYGRFACIYEKQSLVEDFDVHIGEPNFIGHSYKYQYVNVAIASAISAYARIYMYNIMKPIQANLLYIDTDGIFVNKELTSINPKSQKIGEFRLVSYNIFAFFIATKFYFYKKSMGEHNKTIYVFRGLTVSKYIFNTRQIVDSFLSYIQSNSYKKNNLQIQIEMQVIVKEHGFHKRMKINRLFYNKRRIMYKEKKIYTSPWQIKKKE